MPSRVRGRTVGRVSVDRATTPNLARGHQERWQAGRTMRWLRLLVPVVMIVVIWAAFHAHPAPSTGGRGLAVSVALGVFVVGGLGVLVTLRSAVAVNIAFVVVLLTASSGLAWLQVDGVGIAGIFVGVSFLPTHLRAHRSVPLVFVALVFLGVIAAAVGHGSITAAVLNAIMLAAFYGMMFLAMRLAEANQQAEDLLSELGRTRAAQARAAGMAERQRLAREMHDVLAHSLTGLLLQLEAARMLVAGTPADPRLPAAIDRAHQLGRTGLDEARRAIGMLRDDQLPGPELLPGLAAQFQHDKGIPCRLVVSGEPDALSPEARIALYRVAQEALTNITKHARPARVDLHLDYEPCVARLTIEDFGTPVVASPPPPTAGASGYGLTGMRERAELLGGTLAAEPTGTGFRVELQVPA